ncbi:MAG: hypothetical protein CL694_14105 [Chloroflexi bacterium]|nr:hypothetical protein [Chloroflexota bacterium]MQG58099.1 RDD family protein [SAR202 cluster bacterium]HAL46249.1 hypothetical protein [Dehalococcoidia bacterium]
MGNEQVPLGTYCPSCGKQHTVERQFCDQCGQSLLDTSGAQPPGAAGQYGSVGTGCSNCGRQHAGDSKFCNWCGQFLLAPNGVRLAGIGQRFVAMLLDSVLFLATLIIGYLVWWLIVIGKGQTPGKQIMGIRAITDSGMKSGWGRTFVRELLVKGIVFGFLSAFTLGVVGILDYLWALWDIDKQALHDKMAGTFVVQGPRLEI